MCEVNEAQKKCAAVYLLEKRARRAISRVDIRQEQTRTTVGLREESAYARQGRARGSATMRGYRALSHAETESKPDRFKCTRVSSLRDMCEQKNVPYGDHGFVGMACDQNANKKRATAHACVRSGNNPSSHLTQ